MADRKVDELRIAFGDLSITYSRRTEPKAASPSGPPLHRSSSSSASGTTAAAEPDAEAWETRVARAEQAGAAAAARLAGTRPTVPTLPRSTKKATIYVVLRTSDGYVYEPAHAADRWAKVVRLVQDDKGELGEEAVFHSFASLREAKAYVAAAGAKWP